MTYSLSYIHTHTCTPYYVKCNMYLSACVHMHEACTCIQTHAASGLPHKNPVFKYSDLSWPYPSFAKQLHACFPSYSKVDDRQSGDFFEGLRISFRYADRILNTGIFYVFLVNYFCLSYWGLPFSLPTGIQCNTFFLHWMFTVITEMFNLTT